ncbi:hypothetical protein EUGRSUZ_J03095 [Eucalyptus grandis]|uniref:Protein kinase domain-containing protein n=2 Tax=Eucalyptus grandis TaxID=71139 RepID=A0A059AJF2_EUCGR|nr:hypothetical protein EUGRSUZ_J03095 [Eucalyptus grandis]
MRYMECPMYGVICGRRHHRVTILDLHSQGLSGPLSSHIGNLSFLRLLLLQNNSFSLEIPPQIGRLCRLQFLHLSNNSLTGEIPRDISSCMNLLYLRLHYNQLVGGIPVELGSLSNLQEINFIMNQLTGGIPSSIGNLSSLGWIFCTYNHLSGIIPQSLGQLTKLQMLELGLNGLSGTIPPSIFNLSSLIGFDVILNQIHGNLPKDIGFTLPNLQFFSIVHNHFTGSIPSNELSGKVPSLANLYKLEVFPIYHNYLGSGRSDANDLSFICSLTNAANLRNLLAHENILGGTLPVRIGNLSATFTILSLYVNLISGEIPKEITKLVNLQRLLLSYNFLSGSIPSNLGNISKLLALALASNNLSSIIPSSLQNWLNQLSLAENNLKGPIPSYVHGSIPQPLSSLKSIEELDLSNNSFIGEIPKFLEAFQFLEELNLSYNRLEGLLPTQGVFRNVSASFVARNEKLCGGMPEFELPKCVSQNSKNKGGVHKLKLIATILFGLLGITLVVTFIYLCWLKMKRNKPISSSSDDSMLNLSYGAILKANDGFSSTNLIGVRSFGSIYKGLLQENGIAIVVKVLNLTRHGALKSFKAECEALKRTRHRNLLKVLTACSSIDYKGGEFKALVYEFMVNGSLDEWLHPNLAPNDADGHSKKLSLLQRINIFIDVASALDYLHNHCESPIIHCDLGITGLN